MIDLHCHILPGIDDGAETMEAVLRWQRKPLVKESLTSCVRHIIITEISQLKFDVISLVSPLQSELDQRNLPLTVLEGQEVRITGDLIEGYS